MRKVTRADLDREWLRDELLPPFNWIDVFGAVFGDEGKGKIVGIFSPFCDFGDRRNGGAGAGHTLLDLLGVCFRFHLLPSSYAFGKPVFLSPGVLVAIQTLFDEIDENRAKLSYEEPPVWVDFRCPILTPYHLLLEKYLEWVRSDGMSKIGTTGRGMGPLEGLHRLRIGVTVGQLIGDRNDFRNSIELLAKSLDPILKFGEDRIPKFGISLTPRQVADDLLDLVPRLRPMVKDTAWELLQALSKGARTLGEAAQGCLLDNHDGTYPFVTSSDTTSGGMATGTGLPPSAFRRSLRVAVVKVFNSRVGGGPFVAEICDRETMGRFADENRDLFKADHPSRTPFLTHRLERINAGEATEFELATYLQVLAFERGTSTGRGRSLSYPDPVSCSVANNTCDPHAYALTWLDGLSGMNSIKMVEAYELDGERLPPGYFPMDLYGDLKPIYITVPLWKESITGCQHFEDLPTAAQDFVLQYEKILGRHILIVGTGPGHNDYILRRPEGKLKTHFS